MTTNPTEFLSRAGYRQVQSVGANVLSPGADINGVLFNGSTGITVPAAAGTLTGTTLASGVLHSSLTSVGTLAALTVTATITGSITGNAGTATTAAACSGNAATATSVVGGINATITTAKLTSGGTAGSMTFTNGTLTAQTPAT